MTAKRQILSFVPPLLPNQTIYSWVAVFHEKSGNSTIEQTRLQLFGTDRGRWHFQIPSHLTELCASTQLRLGTPEIIVHEATTIPYYTQFRDPTVMSSVLEQVRGSNSKGLARSLGMTRSAFNADPPRRSCHECIISDEDQYGFAYWRRDHQLPGVLVCQKHGTPLLALPNERDSVPGGVFLWPNNDWNKKNNQPLADWSSSTLGDLQCLAKIAAEMVRGKLAGGYSIHRMKNACLLALHDQDLIGVDGSLKLTKAMHDYSNHHINVESLPEIRAAMQRSVEPLLFALKGRERHTHPLEWMLIIGWLFGSWGKFQDEYERANRD